MNREPLIPNASSHRDAFDIILADYQNLLKYIEPNTANFPTHSHALYELLFRACTEFESVAKALLIHIDPTLPRRTILDYRALDKHFPLEVLQVGFTFWRPSPIFAKPFVGWTKNEPPLPWYKAYNDVKHDRAENFKSASFEHVTLALAGLFLAITRTGAIQFTSSREHQPWLYSYFEEYPLYQLVNSDELDARNAEPPASP